MFKQFIFILLTPLLLAVIGSAQSVTTIELPETGNPLDIISLKKDQIHLVTNQGLFLYKENQFQKVDDYHALFLKPSSQNFHIEDQHFFYNNILGGFNKIDFFQSKNTIPTVTGRFKSGLILYGLKYIWIAEQSIFKNTELAWEIAHEIKNGHSHFWDRKVIGKDLWLSNYGNGVYHIIDEEKIKNYRQEDGLFDDFCSSINAEDNRILVGHTGGISIIENNLISTLDLTSNSWRTSDHRNRKITR